MQILELCLLPVSYGKVSEDWFEGKCVEVLPWPGNSQDMNPVEMKYIKMKYIKFQI